ncbi:uncharacterized protein IL334_004501 [Kwoniella shivajii]|uniref:FAD-binding domain-containing protein n=1 Tax=Kwoniella shivajii TaxID=564305 RepID=A0ABZ1D1V2_9TREE|nr:hypothetical protein IL334_004501 [Kwoniella shivajii]
MPSPHVLIVGAGLAGPALALALAKQSIKSTIIERRPDMQDIGGVIMLAPNAMRVMDKILDIGHSLRAKGYSFEAINIHLQEADNKLDHVGGFRVSDGATNGLSISRPVLHEALLAACQEEGMKELIELRYGAKMEHIEETDSGVEAVLEGGERITGDIMIGCDGIGSRVRKHILGDANPEPVYSGIAVIGAVTPASTVTFPSTVQLPAFCYTQHGTFLSFAMDQSGQELQWATSLQVPERDRKTGWDEYRMSGDAVRDVKRIYADTTVEPIRSFVHGLNNENVKFWAPYQMPDLPTWHTSRVCILGDAAHAIPPSAGQGSAQAFEDIGLLSRLLQGAQPGKGKAEYNQLFEYFERTRRQRVDAVRKMTAGAESSRRPTENSWMWWVKKMGVRAVFRFMGTKGYIQGSAITRYDVTTESLSFR